MSEQPPRAIRETLEDWFDGEGLSVEDVSAEALDRLARWLFGAPELAECRVERDRLQTQLDEVLERQSIADYVDAEGLVAAERDRLREALQEIAGCESRFPGDVVDVARRALVPLVSEGETDGR
jgi:hypothetical protein